MLDNKRQKWPDITKGICMLMVMHSHIYTHSHLYEFYAPVFLTSFFFVTGYFLKDRSVCEYIIHEIRTIIIPFVFLAFLDAVSYQYFWKASFIDIFKDILLQDKGIYAALWFLRCLIVTKLLVFVLLKIFRRKETALLLISSGFALLGFLFSVKNIKLPYNIQIALIMQLFTTVGYFIKTKKTEEFITLSQKQTIVYFFGGYFLLFIVQYFYLGNHIVNGSKYTDITNFLLYIFQSIIGIICLYNVSLTIQKFPVSVIFTEIGKNTLVFYGLQMPLFYGIIFCLQNLLSIRIIHSIVFLCTIIMCYMCALIINKYSPKLIGKWK